MDMVIDRQLDGDRQIAVDRQIDIWMIDKYKAMDRLKDSDK